METLNALCLSLTEPELWQNIQGIVWLANTDSKFLWGFLVFLAEVLGLGAGHCKGRKQEGYGLEVDRVMTAEAGI